MRFLKHVKGFITFGVGQIPDDGTIWLETVSRHYLRLSLSLMAAFQFWPEN